MPVKLLLILALMLGYCVTHAGPSEAKKWIEKEFIDSTLSKDQQIIDDQDDSFLLKATVADSHHLLWWIISLGDRIEVLEPSSLRDIVITQIKDMANKYGV